MEKEKKFYVNFVTGKVASDAIDCCSTVNCEDCVYNREEGCTSLLQEDPESYLLQMGYVPFPLNYLEKPSDEAHFVIFPRANIPTVFRLTNAQMALVDKLNELDVLAYDEVIIEDM